MKWLRDLSWRRKRWTLPVERTLVTVTFFLPLMAYNENVTLCEPIDLIGEFKVTYQLIISSGSILWPWNCLSSFHYNSSMKVSLEGLWVGENSDFSGTHEIKVFVLFLDARVRNM